MRTGDRQSGLFEAHNRLEGASPERITPYPAYRPSEVRWLGDVPEHWLVRKLKFISLLRFSNVDKKSVEGEQPVRLCNYVDVYSRDYVTPDIEFMEATASADEVRRFALERGDVLITKDSEAWDDIAVPAYADAELDGVLCGYHLAQVRPDPAIVDGEYLSRAFASHAIRDQFRVAANGITRFGLSKDSIGSSLFPVPPVDEQRAIATFLRRKTARIDELVAKKRRLIELLQEKRTAIISHAVTKGLDPDAPMRPSGIDWLGDVPVHWTIHHLRRVVSRFVDYRGRTPRKTPSGVPLITAGAVRDGYIDHSRVPAYMSEEDYPEWMSRGWPEVGDVVITTEAPLAEVAQVENANVAFAQRIILFKVNRTRILPEYLRYYYLSAPGKTELLSRASGSTATGIRADRLRGSLVVVPPLEEQLRIISHLDQLTVEAAAPVRKIEAAIGLLVEHRAALISAAVTGKIDVRTE